MSMALTTVEHLNQATAEATDSEQCAIKTEETGTGTADEEGANSSGIKRRDIMPRRSKRVPKGLYATEIGEGGVDQDGGGHKFGIGEEVESKMTIDGHNSDNAGMITNLDSSATIRSKDCDNSTARGVTRERNAEDSSKSRKKGTAARTDSFERRCKQLIDFIDEFGHCHVHTRKFSADPSLGEWCSAMRYAYNKIQQGQTPRRNLTQDQIERLEGIGFKWKLK